MTQLSNKMLEELQRRNYSHHTANTYPRIIRDFAEYFHQPPDRLRLEQIRQYQAYLFQTKKLSPATVSQYVSALHFLFVKTMRHRFLTEHIPFPASPSTADRAQRGGSHSAHQLRPGISFTSSSS